MKTEEQLQQERVAIVDRYCKELRELYDHGIITIDDHDRIGFVMGQVIHHLLSMSDPAWVTFKRMIEETRQWRKDNAEWIT